MGKYDQDKCTPYMLHKILECSKYRMSINIDQLRDLVKRKKIFPHNGVLIFEHINMWFAMATSHDSFMMFYSSASNLFGKN